MPEAKKKIALTIGDPAGIGPEIVLKALFNNPEIYEQAVPLVFGHRRILEDQAGHDGLDLQFMNFGDAAEIDSLPPATIACFPDYPHEHLPQRGRIDAIAGQLAFRYIESAIEQALANKIDAIATAPINKEAMRMGGVPYLDHTEILTKLSRSQQTMTLFVTHDLRVFFYSRHISFKEIPGSLQIGPLVEAMKNSVDHLLKIGIKNPHLALAALNPHGGENGMFGREEIDVLEPAVNKARSEGVEVSGPIPADSVFYLAQSGAYDAVLSLYHDQGHIAAKTFDFHRTVSLTMGLPFLRTSVDHGTAMDLAGKHKANETSMTEAIKAALKYAW